MAFWIDKQGNKLTFSEFRTRWKEGINRVTPQQQLDAQIRFTWLTLIGIMAGIIVTSYNFKTMWWLTIILVAAFANTGVGMVGLWQKRNMFRQIELNLKGGENE